ncbi:SHOCT domain-containing protein [Streptomyces beijiangensis]|nr:SHOCT domain-containing protein [Streptomyces beijiangensis]
MVRPVRRPMGSPLLRGMLVGGTAYAVGKNNARRTQSEQDQNEAIQELQAQQASQPYQAPQASQPYQAAAPAPAPATGGEIADRLAQLGQMAQQGLLTPEEFAAAKAKLLGV